MNFTQLQKAAYLNNIPWVHIAPTEFKCSKALFAFMIAMSGEPKEYDIVEDRAKARFMIGTRSCPSSCNHVPLLFIEGVPEDYQEFRVFEDAMKIAAKIDGIGPMIVLEGK